MLLRLSYRLGPNEGWISLRRNRLALALYEQLPPDLAGRSLVEFAGLVRSRFYEEAVDIFVSAGAPPRDKLISRLAELDELDRRAFGKVLLDRGYSYAIPGLDRREPTSLALINRGLDEGPVGCRQGSCGPYLSLSKQGPTCIA